MKNNKPAAAAWRAFDIQAAIDAASPGDTVQVPAGVYNEQLVIDKPLTLTGPDPVDGTAVIDAAGMAAVSTIRIYANDVTVRLLTIQNGPAHGIQGGGVGFENLTGLVIRQNIIRDHGLAGVITGHGAAMRIENNVIRTNGQTVALNRGGILLYPHGECRVTGNTIQNNNIDGVFARGSNTGLLIEDNDIDGHGNSGLTLVWDEKNVTIRHNRITNNGTGGVEETGGIVIIQSMAEEISGNTIKNSNHSGIFWGWTPSTGPPPPQILIKNNVIENSQRDAIYLFSMGPGGFIPPDPFPLTPLVSGNNLRNSGRAGVYVSNLYYYAPGNANPTIHANNITGNVWGVFNATAGTVDATGNWWGAASGPFQATANPGGQGDPVSDRVLFDPWLRGPAVGCVDETGACATCCALFTDPARREDFGYDPDAAACACHDVCVPDVRAVCAKSIERRIPIPGLDSAVGCRGGRRVAGTPVLDSCRIFCAEETLQPDGDDACLVVHNSVGLEFVLRLDTGTGPIYMVVRDMITEACGYSDFRAFPSGDPFDAHGFKDLVKFSDGSCKTLAIENCTIVSAGGSNPCLRVRLRLVDKLWKHENLLVSALKPYAENSTVSSAFNNAHQIGPCADIAPGPNGNNGP